MPEVMKATKDQTNPLVYALQQRSNFNQAIENTFHNLKKTSPQSFDSPSSFEPLSQWIDHTLLKPETTEIQLEKLCQEAQQFQFKAVCVNSAHLSFVVKKLAGSSVLPISVVGFPLGACTTETKVFETREAIRLGAKEIDMVIAIGALKEKKHAFVFSDIEAVVKEAGNIPVKVILETSLLSYEEKVAGCVLSQMAKAAFVKTSTGFSQGGATVEDVNLMRHVVGEAMGVKASGGIKTKDDALKMLAAGANRLGTSQGVNIISDSTTPPSSTPPTAGAY